MKKTWCRLGSEGPSFAAQHVQLPPTTKEAGMLKVGAEVLIQVTPLCPSRTPSTACPCPAMPCSKYLSNAQPSLFGGLGGAKRAEHVGPVLLPSQARPSRSSSTASCVEVRSGGGPGGQRRSRNPALRQKTKKGKGEGGERGEEGRRTAGGARGVPKQAPKTDLGCRGELGGGYLV